MPDDGLGAVGHLVHDDGAAVVLAQMNGKLVAVIKMSADADEAAIMAASLADEKVAARLEGKTVVKHLVINKPSGKLVNLVVR